MLGKLDVTKTNYKKRKFSGISLFVLLVFVVINSLVSPNKCSGSEYFEGICGVGGFTFHYSLINYIDYIGSQYDDVSEGVWQDEFSLHIVANPGLIMNY